MLLSSPSFGALGACLFSMLLSFPILVTAEPQNRYGSLDSPTYPFYIKDKGSSAPKWANNATKWFDPDVDMPDTGVTRNFDFTISRGLAAPDGYQKEVILINGEFPGPMIEANWGDWIQVTVKNQITGPEEGTAMHWHGFLQKDQPWMDGVPSVSQCPIAPGATYTYRFRADRFGFSWYHSHYSAQYAGGLLGPMIIHGPSHVRYDVDIGPVFITDWYHQEYSDIIRGILGTDTKHWDLSSENNLINGKGTYNCSLVTDGTPCSSKSQNARFRFQSGKTHLLRLINAGGEGFEYFSIDGHTMTVVSNDFVPIKPYDTTVVTLGIGQRAEVLVKATGKPTDSYWMRALNSPICGQTTGGNALAEIRYERADMSKLPKSTAQPFTDPGTCADEPLENTIPYFPVRGIPKPETIQVFNINKTINATGQQEWQVNDSAFRGNYNNPLMLLTQQGNTSFVEEQRQLNTYNFGTAKSVRMVLNNVMSWESRLSHPMHMHGHDFFVVAEGRGTWDGKTIVRPENPMRRDTVMLPRAGYVVIDVKLDNPGVWPFHCHIAWHVSEGLYINFLDNPQKFKTKNMDKIMAGTCDAWNKWTSTHVVDQIDSGLRKMMHMEKERAIKPRAHRHRGLKHRGIEGGLIPVAKEMGIEGGLVPKVIRA